MILATFGAVMAWLVASPRVGGPQSPSTREGRAEGRGGWGAAQRQESAEAAETNALDHVVMREYHDDDAPRWANTITYPYDGEGFLHIPDDQASVRTILDGFGRPAQTRSQTWAEQTSAVNLHRISCKVWRERERPAVEADRLRRRLRGRDA